VIARTRKRPRVKSVNFRTFGWLVTRMAVLAIMDNVTPGDLFPQRRPYLARSTTSHVRRIGERLIREDRGRRFWP